MRAAHLLPSLLRRPLQLSGLVIFGVKQVDVIWGVADQHLSAVLAVAERCHAAWLVGQVGGDEPHAHAGSPSAHVVTWGGGEGGSSVGAEDGILLWMCPWVSTAKMWFWLKTTNQMPSSFLNCTIHLIGLFKFFYFFSIYLFIFFTNFNQIKTIMTTVWATSSLLFTPFSWKNAFCLWGETKEVI